MALLERKHFDQSQGRGIVYGDAVPTAAPGINAPQGTLYNINGTGIYYVKAGPAATDWSQVALSSGFLPLTGGTLSGALTVQGGVTATLFNFGTLGQLNADANGVSFLNSGAAWGIRARYALFSDAYSDEANVPSLGIWAKGSISGGALASRSNVTVSGNLNPYLGLNDGTYQAYYEIASTILRHYYNGSVRITMPAAGGVDFPARPTVSGVGVALQGESYTTAQADARYALLTGAEFTGNVTLQNGRGLYLRRTTSNAAVLGLGYDAGTDDLSIVVGGSNMYWRDTGVGVLMALNYLGQLSVGGGYKISGAMVLDTYNSGAYVRISGGGGGGASFALSSVENYAYAQTHYWYNKAGTVSYGLWNATGLWIGPNAPVSAPMLSVVGNPNGLEFGHVNAAGYRGTLGAEASSGAGFLAFHAEAGSAVNTYRTRGIRGSIIRSDAIGGLMIGNTASASADSQSFARLAYIDNLGNFLATGAIYTNGLARISDNTSYTLLYEPAGNFALYLGGSGDPANYYDNTTHYFRSRAGAGIYAKVDPSGVWAIGAGRWHCGDTSGYGGLYNSAGGIYLYASSNAYWNMTSNSTLGALAMLSGYAGTPQGYLYWDVNGFGLLNNTGTWALRCSPGSGLGGTLFGAWGSTGSFSAASLSVSGGGSFGGSVSASDFLDGFNNPVAKMIISSSSPSGTASHGTIWAKVV